MYKRGGSVGAATAAATTDHCTDEAARYLPLNTVQGREGLIETSYRASFVVSKSVASENEISNLPSLECAPPTRFLNLAFP